MDQPQRGVAKRSGASEFPQKTKLLVWERQQYCCQACGLNIAAHGDLRAEYDHAIPVAKGGDNSAENCVLICHRCHRAKTRVDVGQIAKIRREHKRQANAKAPKPVVPGSRKSPWKKRIDGKWVRRSEDGPAKLR